MLSGVGRARGPPLPFVFYPAWQQRVRKNDREAKSRNRAKYGQSELDSPERVRWPKQPHYQGEQPNPLPRSGSVQQVIRQTCLSPHFGMIGQQLRAADATFPVIMAISTAPGFGCKELIC